VTHESADEKGAVAVLVGILAVFLIGLSAFTIDLGSAYVSNRNLQKAADAGALAGAQSLSKVPGSCNSIQSNSVAVAAAKAVAVEVAKKNYPDASWTQTTWDVKCDAASKSLLVKLGNAGTTPARFAGVFGGQPEVTTGRAATATLEVGPYTATRMRPLAMCSTQLTAGPFVRLDYPKDAPPSCGNASGAWWTVDCPGASNNSTSQMVVDVRDGCANGVSVVTAQSESQTAQQLTTTLEAACLGGATPDGGCLESNPGNLDSGQVAASWKYLVDNSVPAIFPVFCAPPQCSDSTIEGSGNNATFPVYKLLGAVICGYHFSKNEKYHSTSGECAGLPSDMYAGSDDSGNTVNYLIIKYVQISASGSNIEAECSLGNIKCDGGIRRTRLVE
jgi:Flp pilus assembly protein TadG